MDEEALYVYEYMVAWDYWPEIVTKGKEFNNIFFVSNQSKIIQYFIRCKIIFQTEVLLLFYPFI